MRPTDTRPATDDPDAQVRRALQLSREGRADLSALADRMAWNAAPEGVQDVVIREVAWRLRERFDWIETRLYECPCRTTIGLKKALPRDNAFTGLLGAMGIKTAPLDLPISHRLGVYRHRATGIEMVLVPGKSSWIHNPDCDECTRFGCHKDDDTASLVFNGAPPLLVARWPATWGQLGRGGDSPGLPITGFPIRHPQGLMAVDSVESVLSLNELRLPTAAEWEHCARAGTTTRFYWGEEMDDSHCWHRENSGEPESEPDNPRGPGWSMQPPTPPRPHAPAEHDAQGKWNAFGLVDCIGNVWEWCAGGEVAGDSFTSRVRDITGIRTPRCPVTDGAPNYGLRPVCDVPGWSEERP